MKQKKIISQKIDADAMEQVFQRTPLQFNNAFPWEAIVWISLCAIVYVVQIYLFLPLINFQSLLSVIATALFECWMLWLFVKLILDAVRISHNKYYIANERLYIEEYMHHYSIPLSSIVDVRWKIGTRFGFGKSVEIILNDSRMILQIFTYKEELFKVLKDRRS